MEDAIQELEEKKHFCEDQMEELKDQLEKLDQALARLRGYDQPPPPLPSDAPLSARTPWP